MPSRASARTKAGSAVAAIALIEWLILAGISSWIDMFIGERFLLNSTNSSVASKLVIVILFFALCSVNHLVLVTRGNGIKFADEFNNLKKSRRILLVTSCLVLLLSVIAFFLYSRFAYRGFFHINS
jgi:hypothetical protein